MQEISFYSQGDWVDLVCRPAPDEHKGNQGIQADYHLQEHTGEVMRTNKMLTRIYGTALCKQRMN